MVLDRHVVIWNRFRITWRLFILFFMSFYADVFLVKARLVISSRYEYIQSIVSRFDPTVMKEAFVTEF